MKRLQSVASRGLGKYCKDQIMNTNTSLSWVRVSNLADNASLARCSNRYS